MNKFSVIFKLSFINTIFFYLPVLANNSPVDYVNTLVGTQSKFELSTGNTYPAIAMPWGMNFWTPQTGDMGDGWTYTYNADKIKGFKQTHQPSPWMNDYGQFALMPVTGGVVFEQNQRASWFSHKAEIAKPYYYKVYLADHDVTTEMTVTERASLFRFTFPEEQNSYVIVDAFDKGSYIKIIPEENKIIGYSTRNSGGVPENFKNYFIIVFDKPFQFTAVALDNQNQPNRNRSKPFMLYYRFLHTQRRTNTRTSSLVFHQFRAGGIEFAGTRRWRFRPFNRKRKEPLERNIIQN